MTVFDLSHLLTTRANWATLGIRRRCERAAPLTDPMLGGK
jgi:hypothetical protein